MVHPFENIPQDNLRRLFIPLLAATLAMMGLMALISTPLETEDAPYGIISFELAGTMETTESILASWDESAKLHAAFGLGLDYLYMLLYSCTIGIACIWAAGVLRLRHFPLVGFGIGLAWAQWLAAALDAIENAGLTILLFGRSSEFWAGLSRWCALGKFALIFAGLTWVFFGLAVRLVVKPAQDTGRNQINS
jgi:hypothetical protein